MVRPKLLGTAWHSVTTAEGTYRLPMHGVLLTSELDSCQGVPAGGKAAAMLFFKSPSQIPLTSRAADTAAVSSCRPHSSLPTLLPTLWLPDCTSKPPAHDNFYIVEVAVFAKHAALEVICTTMLLLIKLHHSTMHCITVHSVVWLGTLRSVLCLTQEQATRCPW